MKERCLKMTKGIMTEINEKLKKGGIIQEDLTQEEAWKMTNFMIEVMTRVKEDIYKMQ